MSLLLRFLSIYQRSGLRGSYRLINVLSRKLKSLQSVPLNTDSGILYADLRISSSRSVLANPKSQTGEDRVMRNFVKKGDVAFDIGAHLGFYTLLLSELVGDAGKVFAFEPNPELLPSLKMTVNGLSNVRLFETALSDRKGRINLFVPEDASMASLSDWTDGIGGSIHQVSCEMQVLSELVEKEKISVPQFIKCDVEGAELSVFKGAAEILDRVDAPIILFETNAKAARAFGLQTTAYFDFLESLANPKYKFYEVSVKGIKELESRNVEFSNVIAVPETKSDLCENILLR